VTKLELGTILEAAQGAASAVDYERQILPALQRQVPCDQLFCVTRGGVSGIALGLDERVRTSTADRVAHYASELASFSRAAIRNGGVGVDLDFFGEAQLKRTAHYREVMQPHSGRSTLIGYLSFRGKIAGSIVFGRSRPGFTEAEQQALRELLPALSVARAALSPSAAPAARQHSSAVAHLTPREREVLSYLTLGYTNPEIALACGTSFRTVRNQMSSLFRKLGASTRAEAVALSLRQ
jgi:DNA-binding CsgD family transcriptional regulator